MTADLVCKVCGGDVHRKANVGRLPETCTPACRRKWRAELERARMQIMRARAGATTPEELRRRIVEDFLRESQARIDAGAATFAELLAAADRA